MPLSSHDLDLLSASLPLWAYTCQGAALQLPLLRQAAALSGQDRLFRQFSAGLLFWGWQERPFNITFAGLLADNRPAMSGLIPATALDSLGQFRAGLRLPGQADLWAEYESLSGPDELTAFFRPRLDGSGESQVWLGLAFERLIDLGAFGPLAELLDQVDRSGQNPFIDRLWAEWAFFSHDPAAEKRLTKLDRELFGWWAEHMLAQLELKHGHNEAAAKRYAALSRLMPWHVNMLLTRHDLTVPPPRIEFEDRSQETAVLLYSWNKAALLEKTLTSLAVSRIGRARIAVLNNGSRDETRQVMERFASVFGPERFQTIELPINIGAPAARNWLLSLPSIQDAKYFAFLDDDITLPPDWLSELFLALARYPDSGAAGARVVDAPAPHALQAADLHLMPKSGTEDDPTERLPILNNAQRLRDSGLFAYTRPCLSVTGCCHLITSEAIRQAGLFDVRFSPTQFDDLDRDLRAFMKDLPCVYAGRLAIPHAQHSSLRQAVNPAAAAHIAGNRMKLESKYSDSQIKQITRLDRDRLRTDLKNKLNDLAD